MHMLLAKFLYFCKVFAIQFFFFVVVFVPEKKKKKKKKLIFFSRQTVEIDRLFLELSGFKLNSCNSYEHNKMKQF